MCRYQQFRTVNKIITRVLEKRKTEERKGLIWHTQGSGKSLTMVFTVLKLKQHLTIKAATLQSPNILVITDRVDLDDQISNTFQACNLPNPTQITSIPDLTKHIRSNTTGMTILSTIFKFSGLSEPINMSENWIICCDESHRTQEKDLGIYLRATFPKAHFFGFTGTPVQNSDHDTYAAFSPPGETYLDKYSIDDAVADGATVPIHYTARKAEWHLEAEKLDILFDQWFVNENDTVREEIKKRGLSISILAKHEKRIELIAYDLWTHFKKSAMPDGYKAQIVTVDREAVILYKRALNKIIKEDFISQDIPGEEAEIKADEISVCVYSPAQGDNKPSEDDYNQSIRNDLVKYQVNADKTGKWAKIRESGSNKTEKEVKKAFKVKGKPPYFLIVCAKLLTGFDAPCESVMYLDKPLKEHNLLQAIARTNRIEGPDKQNGLIVDYIGVTKYLNEALATYRQEDIKNALHTIDELKDALEANHREVMSYVTIVRNTENVNLEYNALIQALGTLDVWLTFKLKANAFVKAFEVLSPDPYVLEFRADLKWIAGFIALATMHFEKRESFALKNYSAKIREMLEKHLQVIGITTLIKLRHLTDPSFFQDFDTKDKSGEDINTAAIRKATELKKIIKEKVAENSQQYTPFSARVMELIKRFESGLINAAEMLKEAEELSKDIIKEGNAYKKSGLNKNAYGLYKILEIFKPVTEARESAGEYAHQKIQGDPEYLNTLQKLSIDIDELYTSSETAPVGWHLKEQLKKELRQKIRRIIIPAGFTDWEKIPAEIEHNALKHYVKVV